MLRFYRLLLLLDLTWTHVLKGVDSGPGLGPTLVFLSGPEAQQVLVRQRRANSFLEELRPGNMERECVEEYCNYEEAREIFDNSERTNEFWAKYVDGDDCESGPCENGGLCRDAVGGFSCVCTAGFRGDTCQTAVLVLCEEENGGCEHFCDVERSAVRCSCADGYFLSHDQRSCQSTEPFKCGVIIRDQVGPLQARSTTYPNVNQNFTEDQNHTEHESNFDSSKSNRTSPVNAPDPGSSVAPPQQEPALELSVDLGVESSDLEKIRSDMKTWPQIMNGYNCAPGDCPWQALLLNEQYRGFCGGTILNELVILTAAHCMNQSQNFFVLLGEFDTRVKHGNEALHQVEVVLVHKFYRPEIHHHDMALIKLRRPISFTRDILPACLPTKDFAQKVLMSEPVGVVSGFSRSFVLQRLAVPYVERLRCVESTPFPISSHMFCAGYEEGGEAECPGDWGGPHLTQYKDTYFLTGVATWSHGCGRRGQYGLYTQVSKYLPWIRKGMQLLVSFNQTQNQDPDKEQSNRKRKRRSAPETQQARILKPAAHLQM